MPKRSSSVGQIESLSGRVGRPSGFASDGASRRSRRALRPAVLARVCLPPPGIPGSVGATPIQNVGAYGQEVSDTITRVRAYDRQAQQVEELAPGGCEFTYRSSAFKRNPGRWLVLSVTFALHRDRESRPIRYA